ncbi:MAG: ATP-binding protein [Clostridia bacterium]|nr:ATP-binding protein [Clostridia bacterium]
MSVNKNEYKPRIIDSKIEEYLSVFGAVCVEGPKWCGKTWSSSYHCKSEIMIGDPDGNFQNRRLAEMSPSLVLAGDTPRLIDEWQEVPPLWDAVRHMVDKKNEKGQYILTGSATPNHKGIMHSGAGRIARLRMRPMSLFEAGFSSGKVSLKELCDGNLTPVMTGEVELRKIAGYICRGGWPGNIDTPDDKAGLLPAEYLKAVIEDDVYRIDGIKRDVAKMNLLLRSLARNESTTVSNKTLRNDVKAIDDEDIDTDTISCYLDIFTRLFLLDNQPPFASGIRSSVRIKQAEKRHFADPSLACALLKVTPDRLTYDLETFDFLFEALCERDLRIYAESFDGKLYHYRDYNNREIDAVIELPGGKWCAFEIKLGANQIDKAAKGLIKLKNSIEAEGGIAPSVLCVICGLSSAAYVRDDGVFVVPITALRD